MKVSTVLDRIDTGAVALPEFQRGYVWGRRQVRDLVESMYRRFPIGSLLLWETATEAAPARGDGPLQPGYVSLLLDGQQRVTSLYGLLRGEPPPFFDGDRRAFTELRFHVESESFQFYAPVTMRDDPLWIDVGVLMRDGPAAMLTQLMQRTDGATDPDRFQRYLNNLTQLHAIRDIELHEETITGADKTIDVVVDLFNRVNSGGTKLSKGDLTLAKICAAWPDARGEMKRVLRGWAEAGYSFTMDWLLRNMSAVLTGRSELGALAGLPVTDVQGGLEQTERCVDAALNLIASRLGLDDSHVLGGRGAIPVLTRYLADRDGRLPNAADADKLLFWYAHALLWGRYAGSTETVLNTDLGHIVAKPGATTGADGLDALIGELHRQRGELTVRPEDFVGWSRGARFYPLLYMLTRVGRARDLGTGLELRRALLGRRAALEVHHLFPKALLYRRGYKRPEVNALANFAFLTVETNRSLSDRQPAEYLAEAERRQPGVLASQWVPDDPDLWEIDRYPEFLERRRTLLAGAANVMLDELRRGVVAEPTDRPNRVTVVQHDDEDEAIAAVQQWMEARGLRTGHEDWVLLGLDGAVEEAVLDLAWPDGLEHDGERVALLLDEPAEVRDAAGRHGFRFFTDANDLLAYADQATLATP